MKNKIASMILALSLLCLSSCSDSSSNNELKTTKDSSAETTTVASETETTTTTSATTTTPPTTTTTEALPEIKSVALNQTFDVGNTMSVTLTSTEWCEEIKPSKTSGIYSYYEDKNGEKYFVIHGSLKNLSSKELDAKYSGKAVLTINNKYNQDAIMVTEDVDGNSFYDPVKPLQTRPLYIFCSISDELFNECKTIELSLNLVSDDAKIGYFYTEDTPHESFTISFNK